MGRLFMVVALAVVVMSVVRWIVRQSEARRRLALPGRAPNNPISVLRYDEIDATVSTERCECGGPLRTKSEGGTETFRVVHTECPRCEEITDLFFDISGIRH